MDEFEKCRWLRGRMVRSDRDRGVRVVMSGCRGVDLYHVVWVVVLLI